MLVTKVEAYFFFNLSTTAGCYQSSPISSLICVDTDVGDLLNSPADISRYGIRLILHISGIQNSSLCCVQPYIPT